MLTHLVSTCPTDWETIRPSSGIVTGRVAGMLRLCMASFRPDMTWTGGAMKTVFEKASVYADKCTGCTICVKVCPTIAIDMHDKLAVIDEHQCFGCHACEQACPFDAISMVSTREVTDPRTAVSVVRPPWTIGDDAPTVNDEAASDLCVRAGLHPDQPLCVCVEELRARKVAAMVLDSSTRPDLLALATGLRSGCTFLCISGLVRMLDAAGFGAETPPGNNWNWYPGCPTQFDLPADLDKRYGSLGYRFADDRKLMSDVVASFDARKDGGL